MNPSEKIDSASLDAGATSGVPDLSRRLAAVEERLVVTARDIQSLMRHAGITPTVDQFLSGIRDRKRAYDERTRGKVADSSRIRVAQPSPLILPEKSWLRREPPRDPADRQDDYMEKFDFRTLYYDAFRCGDDVWLSGPPLHNLRGPVREGAWQIDGKDVDRRVKLRDWSRTQRSLVSRSAGDELSLTVAGDELTSQIGTDDSDMFADKKAIVAKSKDNDLIWIQDFLRYYHIVHGVTAVVLYDNNSTRYTAEDVAAAIAEVDGIEVGVVVSWNFPFGPNGGPNKKWDSDYCQYSILEHARFRYLRHAAGVINADIDELVLTDDGRPVFDHAAESLAGAIVYDGTWIAKATSQPMAQDRQRRFVDYRHKVRGKTTNKWTVIPSRIDPKTTQWRVHSLVGSNAIPNEHVDHRHYQGVNNSWKYERAETVVDPGKHVLDDRMNLVINLVFDEESEV